MERQPSFLDGQFGRRLTGLHNYWAMSLKGPGQTCFTFCLDFKPVFKPVLLFVLISGLQQLQIV